MFEVLLCARYPRGHGCAYDNRLGAVYSVLWDDTLQGTVRGRICVSLCTSHKVWGLPQSGLFSLNSGRSPTNKGLLY